MTPTKKKFPRRPSKEYTYTVKEPAQLLDFLIATMNDKSRTTVKSYLAHRQVAINGIPTTRYNIPLHKGDKVTINFTRGYRLFQHKRLRIIFEDDYLVVVEKGYGLLSIATQNQKPKQHTALSATTSNAKTPTRTYSLYTDWIETRRV